MRVRLGDVLVRLGVLTESQREAVVEAQATSGRPFGVLAEELFGVSSRDVERAWASQYTELTGRVSIPASPAEPEVLSAIERRQAWQFQILPLRREGRELIVATTERALPRAMRFAGWAIPHSCSFVIATDRDMARGLDKAYPMAGGRQAIGEDRLSA
ncbi:MAG: hypothetical protein IPJ41_10060 [Phycisphaerales bacterium]|nr:hypothetical protein [Phycisphaerales bacterium]